MKIEPSRSAMMRRDKLGAMLAFRNVLHGPAIEMLRSTMTIPGPNGSVSEDLIQDYKLSRKYPDDPEAQREGLADHAVRALLTGLDYDLRNEATQTAFAVIRSRFRIFTPEEMAENPYVRRIKFPDAPVEKDGFELGHDMYAAGEYFMYDSGCRSGHLPMASQPSIGIFERPYRYMRASKNGSMWMSITPNEINTIQPHIDMSHGSVLALGLGLGYFPYMTHMKPDVSSVTIVEYDAAAIELFETYILPQFDHPEKIKLVQADAVEYIENLKDGQYDFCFADIWNGAADIDPYLAIKTSARHLKKTKMSYWVEDSLLDKMQTRLFCILSRDLVKAFARKHHIDPSAAPYLPVIDDPMTRFLENLTAKETVQSARDIDKLLRLDNISKLIDQRKNVIWTRQDYKWPEIEGAC